MNEIIKITSKNELGIKVDAAEKRYNAKFIGEFCLGYPNGTWSESPCQLYWQETPPKKEYSNYFALVFSNNSLYIASGESIVKSDFFAIEHNGEVLHSKCRHDFKMTKDGSAGIDGGRDYLRIIGSPQHILVLGFDGPNLIVKKRVTSVRELK